MSSLACCTITGADDQVDPMELARLSEQYQFLEWGTLYSESRTPSPRYPSRAWLKEFEAYKLPCSLHLCGKRAIENFQWLGFQRWKNLPAYGRVQLNFRADQPWVDLARIAKMTWGINGKIITQHNQINQDVWRHLGREHFQILFDASGGRGNFLDPAHYPQPLFGKTCGYAGGIGPENVALALDAAEKATRGGPFWIDMESGVRTEDRFDLAKVEQVAELATDWLRRGGRDERARTAIW